MNGTISYANRVIGDMQMEIQRKALTQEIVNLEQRLTPLAPPSFYRLRDELRLLLTGMREAKRDFHAIPVRKRRWWDDVKIRIYIWSTEGRFE